MDGMRKNMKTMSTYSVFRPRFEARNFRIQNRIFIHQNGTSGTEEEGLEYQFYAVKSYTNLALSNSLPSVVTTLNKHGLTR